MALYLCMILITHEHVGLKVKVVKLGETDIPISPTFGKVSPKSVHSDPIAKPKLSGSLKEYKP